MGRIVTAQARRNRGHCAAVSPQMTACARPNENCAPQSEDCASKKSTDSRLLECKSRPKTPKLVFTALDFVSKNCFFVIFENLTETHLSFGTKTFSLVFTSEFVENRKNFETTTAICRNFATKTFFLTSRAPIEFT